MTEEARKDMPDKEPAQAGPPGKVEGGSGEGRPRRPAPPLRFALSHARRGRGLLMTRPNDESLLFLPCNDVHTFGMRHPIDVAFVDQSGRVLQTEYEVGPHRRLKNRRAVAVVERFSTQKTPWLAPGDQLGVVGLKGETK